MLSLQIGMKGFGHIGWPLVIAGAVLTQSLALGVSHRSAREAARSIWMAGRDTTEAAETADTTVAAAAIAADSLADTARTLAAAFAADSLADTTVAADSLGRPDTLARTDTLGFFDEEEELGGFEEETPKIFARDTMKVPDSLKTTDPFLYQYYIAVKDSLTHRIVVDSLYASAAAFRDSVAKYREAGDTLRFRADSLLARCDSLAAFRVDSLYLADSTDVATRKFNAWYASLTKKERRRYDYEKALPAKLHRIDSILQRKDSLRAIRDSIRENTPRILTSYAVPDTMRYKRMLTWTHDPANNRLNFQPFDTSYNYYYFDEPFYRKDVNVSYLGVIGTAVETYDFMKREYDSDVSFYKPYEVYSYTPATLPMYNTKTPYTELSYHGTLFANKEKEEDNIRIFTTQNILPSLNLTVEYKRYGSGGMLLKEDTFNKTFVLASNYLGERYVAHGGYIYNRIKHQENGGIIDNFWIRDTTVETREIGVSLLDAKNKITKHTVFYDQSYRIPFTFIEKMRARKDSTYQADTLGRDITTAFIGTGSEYSVFHKVYTDNIASDAGKDFYNNTFLINPTTSFDSLRVMRFDNRAFIRLQPWSENAVVSKIEGGIGDRLQSFYLFTPKSYLAKPENTVWNTVYAYAGAEGRISDAVWWQGMGKLGVAGDEAGDFNVRADAGFHFFPFRRNRKSPVTFKGTFETSLRRPDYYAEHFYSNHYSWENSFDKISTTKVRGSLDIPNWDLSLSAGYALVSGHVYYDETGIARQHGGAISVLSLSAMKNFTLLNFFHFDHRGVFQVSSNEDVLPLPAAALALRYYIQFPVVKNVLNLQFGANAWYTAKWYAPGYNPVAGVFTLQHEEKYGNVPYIDLFLNAQWKRACIFLKIENIGMGWPTDKSDYFSAHHYIRPHQSFKLGLHWPFYAQPNRNEGVKASSGMGGGGGSSSGRSSSRR